MRNYELPISPNYVHNWGIKEAMREILQNAIDAEKSGYEKDIWYSKDTTTLYITTSGTTLPMSSLVLGCSSKSDVEGMIGKFGEGYKLALVVLLRKGFNVYIENGNERWTPSFKVSDTFQTQVLNIDVVEFDGDNKITFIIPGVTETLYAELLTYFPCIDNAYGEVVASDNGYILLDSKFKGKMYVEGLYIQSDNNFKHGYNFSSSVVELDRDRKAINYYELRKLTAASVVTAERCSPELFKAISDSYTDVKDIKEVLDEASEHFLTEYRDMLYQEKELDDNTLIATDSVMKQLKQMDVDVPIAKGTEIESYLIAKANDKLGLIYEAQDQVNKKSAEQDAWYYVRVSHFRELMAWLYINKKYLTKKAQADFLKILKNMEPSDYTYIKKYIPEEFDWSIDSMIKLENEINTQQEETVVDDDFLLDTYVCA